MRKNWLNTYLKKFVITGLVLLPACGPVPVREKNMTVKQFAKIKKTCHATGADIEPMQVVQKIDIYWHDALEKENAQSFECLKHELSKSTLSYGIIF